MASTVPSPTPPPPPPHEEVENDGQQPYSPIDHHHQFTTSISPSSPSKPPPEHVERQPQPPAEVTYRQQLPPPIVTEQRPENFSPNSDHELTLSKQPSPSPSTPPSGTDGYAGSPNCRKNPSPNLNSDHESPVPYSPAKLQGNPKEPSLSPPSSLPLGVPLLQPALPSKPQIAPWTHPETVNLIQAYQEKWYSLNRGPLKAGQWEEVAITVAARCGYDEPTKTAKQCQHKMEKLRKRYRAERGKARSKACAWIFFKLMDDLEKGPLPVSSSPPVVSMEYQNLGNSNVKKRKNDDRDSDGDVEFLVNKKSSRSKNSNHHVSNDSLARSLRFSDGGNKVVRGLRTPVVRKCKGLYQEEDAGEEDVVAQLAAEIKSFAEKFVKMENKKIEMIKEVERYRLQMENKRMEMILESQQMLVETVSKAFSSSYKTHRLSAT